MNGLGLGLELGWGPRGPI